MIIQPEWGTRNVNKYFYENEARRIAAFNEIFGDVELTAAEMRTLVWLAVWVGGMYSRKRTFGYPKSYGGSKAAGTAARP